MTDSPAEPARRIPLWNEALMAGIHILEVPLIRWRAFPAFYRLLARPYEWFRPLSAFADDLFLETVEPHDIVVEVGSGTGYLLRRAAARARACIGVELSPEMIQLAREKDDRTLYVRGDMTKLPIRTGSVQQCWSMGSFLYVDPQAALEEMRRILVPRGTLAILLERRIFPAFLPEFREPRLGRAIAEAGLEVVERVPIGHLYEWVRLRGTRT